MTDRAPPCAPVRRNSGRMRREIWRSTGRYCRTTRRIRRRSSASWRPPHVARVAYVNQRLVVAAIEPRGATASYDPAHDRYTLRVCSQGAPPCGNAGPHHGRRPQRLRVITEDVGGAFGMKTSPYPEYPALLVAARITRPAGALDVDPVGSLPQRQSGAGLCSRRRVGARRRGKFLALRIRCLSISAPFSAPFGATCRP